MPIAGIGLHLIIAAFFAIHAVRNGQERYWLFILFAFPGIGSLVYAVSVWLPEMRLTRQGRQLVGGVRHALDPSRELREALDAVETSANSQNRMRLAEAFVASGRASEAIPHYQAALRSVHKDDPDIQVGLAKAYLEAGHATEARDLLDGLIKRVPDFRSPEGHLIYARAVAALGDRAQTHEEFGTLIGYYAGYEPRARYAEILAGWGETERARELCERSLREAKRLPGYSRTMNKEWIGRLQRVQKSLTVPSA